MLYNYINMSVTFPNETTPRNIVNEKESRITQFIIHTGLAKNKQQVNIILLIVIFSCAVVVLFFLLPESEGKNLSPIEINNAGNITEVTNS